MEYAEARDGERVTVRLRGDLDMASSDTFRRAVISRFDAAGVEVVVLDLGGVGFLDSAGLTALVDIQETAQAAGVRLVLTNVSRQTRKLMSVTSLLDLFTLE